MMTAMIGQIRFKNYKVLRDTTLPLGQLTLIVGPNGSGKTTALSALKKIRDNADLGGCVSAGVQPQQPEVSIQLLWAKPCEGWVTSLRHMGGAVPRSSTPPQRGMQDVYVVITRELERIVKGTATYSLDAGILAQPVRLHPEAKLGERGEGLVAVLDRLRDTHYERFEALNEEFARWLPEFDRIVFETPDEGSRAIGLRTRAGQHIIRAGDISQGTLLALAILTLAYVPEPPPIVGLEEPDRGMHPRLLRDVRDAMYRLAYPDSFREKRPPVQVIATTHSPYMLDLFKDHPEEIVIASRADDNVRFDRLVDLPNASEILEGALLGEVWYSGVLGGAPTER